MMECGSNSRPHAASMDCLCESKVPSGVVHDHHPVIEVCMTKSLTGFSDWPRRPDLCHLEDDEAAMAVRVRTKRSPGLLTMSALGQKRTLSVAPVYVCLAPRKRISGWMLLRSGSSTRSSSVGASRPDTTSSPPTISLSSSSCIRLWLRVYECTA
jgi:hypothetical protein